MARTVSTGKLLNSLAERTIEHNKILKRDINQRRNGMEDLYGQAFMVNGDGGSPATFYISISPNYTYIEQFAFKFVIMPFTTTVTGATDSAEVEVKNKSLSISNNAITPNPHKHDTEPHTHNIIDGMAFIPTASKNWRVVIAGVDITDYLKEQVADTEGADWLGDKGEGVYPNNKLEEDEEEDELTVNFYDILDVACVLDAEGNVTDREKLLKAEMKKVEVYSDAPFGLQAYLFLKYPHTNR